MPDAPDPQVLQLQQNFEKNKGYARPADSYATTLNPLSESKFRQWVAANKVPFDPNAKVSDYDMRGFWLALQNKDPRAVAGINPNDKQIHYSDFWKTPYHQSFSAESQWAAKGAPTWNKESQLVMPDGRVVFDEKALQKVVEGKGGG